MPAPHNRNDQAADPFAFLADVDPAKEAQLRALWALSVEERIERMYARQLSTTQLWAWAQRHPGQVPTLSGEWWFLAVDLADNET